MPGAPLHVAIVGGGKGGASLLRALHHMARIRVVGIAEIDAADFRTLISRPEVDIIVQATPDPAVEEEIKRCKLPRAAVVVKQAMQLILTLVEQEQELNRALQLKERERNLILDSTHDGVLAVNAQGLVTVFNTAAERVTGLQRQQVLGRPAAEMIPGSRLSQVLASGRAELNQQQKLRATTIVTNRVPVRDEAGQVVGAVAVFRDITEVKALAEEMTDLRETKALLEAIINATSDAITVVNAEGLGLLVNPAYTRLTAMQPEQVIGKPATADLAPGQESVHLRVLKTRQPIRAVPMQVGPHQRDVLATCTPILVDGVLKGSVGVIHDVSEIWRLTRELESTRRLVRRLQSRYTFDDIVAHSSVMQAAVEQARRVAQTPATVLLRGASGTGKELFAHAIHNASGRAGPFIRVNCAAIPDSLLESELFGYAEGAFTGARKGGHKGLFEEAHSGTIFLDEIGDISPNIQAKLLRVLQEKEIRRVGEPGTVKVDVRIIAATNADLESRMARGEFREDLYYRLNVVPIVIPPLRHRREDIPDLVQRFVAKCNGEYGRSVQGVEDGVVEVLMAHHWPGNVRELENVIGRAIIAMDNREGQIRPEHLLPLGNGMTAETPAPPAGAAARPLAEVVAEAERAALVTALTATGGNKTEAARRLGLAPRTLYYKLVRHGLHQPGELGEELPSSG